MPVLGEKRFGMELDADHGMVVVTQGHDRAARGGGRDLYLGRQPVGSDLE